MNYKETFAKIFNKENLKKIKPVLKGCGLVILSLFVAVLLFIGIQILLAPKVSEIDATPQGYLTTILDKDGNMTRQLSVSESNRIYVTLDEIPQDLENAFIAIEDTRFRDHNGIDLKGILRAAWQGITTGSFSQGASTITQQLLKNNVFTDWMEEESFFEKICRKIQEQYLAVQLEKEYSKDWILENYLNTINLGGGTRGVQVASQYYFGKDVSELTLTECALIAGITKNPSAYDPKKHPEKSMERQQLVLKAMLRDGYISQEQYDQAVQDDVIARLDADATLAGTQVFSWYEDAMLEQLVKDLMQLYGYNEAEAWNEVYSGGLTIYSTLDTNLQKICESVATDSSWYKDNEEISIVMTDVSTGAVAAMVGGREEKDSSLIYNRATDSVRQPGSTIKVIGEYAAAIDTNKISLGKVVDDEPYSYSDGTSIQNAYGTYKGITTIHDAIVSSSNVVALKIYQDVGGNTVYDYLKRFGISTLTDEDINEPLSIGGTYNGVTNLELTAAYNAIAHDGAYVKPHYYTKVEDRDGQTILTYDSEVTTPITKDTAELLTYALEDVITSGTGTEAAVKGVTLAGKSGTTNDSKDVWFVGFSAYYTCGIWGGYDDNATQTDGTYVKQIWQNIMQQAHKGKENKLIVDTENLSAVYICTKCGNTVLNGICDVTVQGDMTAKEYYVKGTEPTEPCDCHVSVKVCAESGKTPNSFCPTGNNITKVYLKSGTEGTQDSEYILAKHSDVCDIHKLFDDPAEEGSGDERNFFEKLLDFILGR